MKKTIITLTLVAALAALGGQAFAYGPGQGCWGQGGVAAGDTENYQEFLDKTADLRKSLTLDHTEMATIMHSANPDPAAVRALAERILDTEEAISEQAEAMGLDDDWTCPYGGYGHQNYGHQNYNHRGYGHGGHMMW